METDKNPNEYIFFPLDTPDLEYAIKITGALKGLIGGVKIGKEFFTSLGPDGVIRINELGVPVFIDLKFHDIPNTVAGAVRSAIDLKPMMINVHAQGGRTMLKAARDAGIEHADKMNITPPLILGVTVLTSMDDQDLAEVGVSDKILDQVKRLAMLCQECGLDGVVCSAGEIESLRNLCGRDFKLLSPGIRPKWASKNDQKRSVTPREAIELGADYLVIGRPISSADNPAEAAKKIIFEISEVKS